MLSNDQILQNFLCLSSEEFKFFQKNQKEKEKNDYSLNATTFSDINKIYDYAQAYLKTSLTASILKNKSYETIEIDVLMDKVRKYEENLLNLITQLEIFSKIERNYLLSKEPLNENVFESVEKWNIYLNSEKNGLEVNKF